MRNTSFFLGTLLAITLAGTGCSKEDDDENPVPGSTWDIHVTDPDGSTFVLANGVFTFTNTSFNVHIKTSLIGMGNIEKEFDMSGGKSGDTIVLDHFILNLTDPVETVVVNGRVGVTGNTMSGYGDYSIVQPPDTLHFYGQFNVTSNRTK